MGQKLYFYGGQSHELKTVYKDFFSLDFSKDFSLVSSPFKLETFGDIGLLAGQYALQSLANFLLT